MNGKQLPPLFSLGMAALIGFCGLPSLAQQVPPSVPAKFDVISIKPVDSDRNGSPTNIEHGNLMAVNISIRRLIELAWPMEVPS